jgi:hypothetical protein
MRDNYIYTMFAKSKLTTSPSSKAATTHKTSPQHNYLNARDPTAHAHKYFSRERSHDSPDYGLTRDRMDYRHRNHTENKYNRHSAVTINPRSKSGTSYLKTHSQSIDYSLHKKHSLKAPEEQRQEKLLMMREERIGKIREGFAMKNRMGGQKKVHSSVTGNAKLNSFTQLARKQPPKEANALDAESAPSRNAPKFFDFCESNRYRETRAAT